MSTTLLRARRHSPQERAYTVIYGAGRRMACRWRETMQKYVR